MITSGFIYLAGLLISGILLILSPLGGDGGFPQGVDDAVTFFSGYIGKADVFIPIDALYDVVMFVIIFEIIVLTFNIIRWLTSYVPFVGGR